jgi:hypothetical protein
MIAHVVLLRLRRGVTEHEVQQALDHVRALKDVIPGILSVDAGDTSVRHTKATAAGSSCASSNREDLHLYASHDAHQPVSQELQRLCESIIDFDLEVAS